jgi:hypothetical protein
VEYYEQYAEDFYVKIPPAESKWLERAIPLAKRYLDSHGILGDTEIFFEFDCLSIRALKSANLGTVVDLLQLWVQKWHKDKVFAIEYALSGSSAQIDTFGGGVVVFSATEQRWSNIEKFLADALDELERKNKK